MKQILMSLSLSILTYNSIAQNDAIQTIDWSIPTQLPVAEGHHKQMGLAGAISGYHNDVFIVAGGSNFEDALPWEGGKKKYFDDIYFLKKDKNGVFTWQEKTLRLPEKKAYAAVVNTSDGIIYVGGENEKGLSNKVVLIQVFRNQINTKISIFPDLPFALTNAAATLVNNQLFVAGGEKTDGVSSTLMSLDLDNLALGWKILPNIPEKVSHTVLLNHGEKLYLLGGRQKQESGISTFFSACFAFNLVTQMWEKLQDLPYPLSAGTGCVIGENTLAMFGGDKGTTFHQVEKLLVAIQAEQNAEKKQRLIQEKNQLQINHPGFSQEVLLYNISSNQWTNNNKIGFQTPVTTQAVVWDKQIIIPCGEIKAGVRTANILVGKLKP